jgi:hypothetical protein
MSNKLIELLELEGPELSREFDRASISGRGTPQEVADFRENAFRDFLSRYFPFPYRTAKGNIIDAFGGSSQSIDCILLHPSHPHTVDRFNKHTVILADGVVAAIEIKPDLQDQRELQRGLAQLHTVKKLTRWRTPLLLAKHLPQAQDLVNLSKKVPSFIFSERVKSNPLDTGLEIVDFYKKNAIPIDEQLDFVVVNNLGIIANYKHPEKTLLKDSIGFVWEEWGSQTLAAILIKLNWVDPPEASVQEPLLKQYLIDISPVRCLAIHGWIIR